MALTDILAPSGESGESLVNRQDIGLPTEIISALYNEFTLPAGAGAGAVFPDEGDVDLGIVYGSTGTDMTGTLVQPAESDVMTGISYGANGTEFEGTATGGGGFISIINE